MRCARWRWRALFESQSGGLGPVEASSMTASISATSGRQQILQGWSSITHSPPLERAEYFAGWLHALVAAAPTLRRWRHPRDCSGRGKSTPKMQDTRIGLVDEAGRLPSFSVCLRTDTPFDQLLISCVRDETDITATWAKKAGWRRRLQSRNHWLRSNLAPVHEIFQRLPSLRFTSFIRDPLGFRVAAKDVMETVRALEHRRHAGNQKAVASCPYGFGDRVSDGGGYFLAGAVTGDGPGSQANSSQEHPEMMRPAVAYRAAISSSSSGMGGGQPRAVLVHVSSVHVSSL